MTDNLRKSSVDLVKEELREEAQSEFLLFLSSCRDELKKRDLQQALKAYLNKLPQELKMDASQALEQTSPESSME